MILREKDRLEIIAIADRTLKTPLEIMTYGSRVTGEAHDTSDLDLAVRCKNGKPLEFLELSRFKQAIEDSSIPIIIQVFDWFLLPESFQHNILQKFEVLWEREYTQ